ncbi:DUF4145 domain-containing protein [Shewanella algae]|uniref:DUF4145 domain-containing protein n=1 Tax=Shewanella algae TaxID=38313 RepID=UPI001AAC501D|nr:DUF4145 domain-containing protein [Shewanella algae]MBO2569128.1 DUF4145 domain-containing protein [Shewanella algae]
MDGQRLRCNECQGVTLHKVLYNYEQDLSVDEFYSSRETILLECCGCESVKIKILETSDYSDFGTSGLIPEVSIFPPETFRQKPKWIGELVFPFHADYGPESKNIVEVIDEIYLAFQNGCVRLAVMGIRSLIEQVMVQTLGDKGSFSQNMKGFKEAGYISNVQFEALDLVINAGNATTHRNYKPDTDQVIAAMDIVENVIESMLVLKKKNVNLKNIPKRSKNKS